MISSRYYRPTLEELAALRGSSGLRAVSTFSGAGGSCLGLERAGFEIVYASEFVEPAAEVYRANHPGVPVDVRDIREVRPEEILEAIGLEIGELDLLEGSPPCAAFSKAGIRNAGWGEERKYSETRQRTDDLFEHFARILSGLRPRAFFAENVPELAAGRAAGYFREILELLTLEGGYRVSARTIDAALVGAPQRRKRIIFVGIREDLDADPVFPAPSPGPPITLREALRQADPVPAFEGDGPSIADVCLGPEWLKLSPGQSSPKYFQLTRPDLDRPCPTIQASGGGSSSTATVCHPTEPRKFTIDELLSISAFPPDFVLSGTYAQRWERLGRSVLPPVSYAVGRTLRDEVLS